MTDPAPRFARAAASGTFMRAHRYLILLLVLVLYIFSEAYAQRAFFSQTMSSVFLTLLALVVFLVVFDGWWERAAAFVVALAGLAFAWTHLLPLAMIDSLVHGVAHHLLMAAFMGFAVAVILGNIFRRGRITNDDVLGTVCGYVLAAGCFANLYAACELAVPGSFSVAAESQVLKDAHTRTALFNYFSIVTLTTVGYGDITPVRAPATAIAMVEAIFGQFYIAVVVAQLVGLWMSQAGRGKSPREP
jgi:hypothetical protein